MPLPAATVLTVMPRMPKWVAWPAVQLDMAALMAASGVPSAGLAGTTLTIAPPELSWSPRIDTVSTADSTVASRWERHAAAWSLRLYVRGSPVTGWRGGGTLTMV